jgi:hypothetical protein
MEASKEYVQDCVNTYFPFLKEEGFSEFIEEEKYFICPKHRAQNKFVTLSFQYQGFGRLMHLHINKYYFRELEPQNALLKNIEQRNTEIENHVWHKKKKKNDYVQFDEEIKVLQIAWLTEMSEVIKRSIQVLRGDLSILELNSNQT